MNESQKIQTTKNYALFTLSAENRSLNIRRWGSLRESLIKYGFISAYPMVCKRIKGALIVIDGQHRFMIAQSLQIPVFYVVSDDEADVAEINSSAKRWSFEDYVNRYAKKGNEHYVSLREFSSRHDIPVSISAGLLFNNSGNGGSSNYSEQIKDGTYTVKNLPYAERCARIFNAFREFSRDCSSSVLLRALAAACRVPEFDDDRMLKAIPKRPDFIKRYSNRDSYLDMLEKIYNDQLRDENRIPLRFRAEQVLKSLSACVKPETKSKK